MVMAFLVLALCGLLIAVAVLVVWAIANDRSSRRK